MTDDKQIRELANQLGRVAGALKVLEYDIKFNQVKGAEGISKRLNDIYKYAMLPSSEAYNKKIN